jgi:hypothetical protein
MVKAGPLKKVLRIVRIGAHILCPDIQQMLRAFCAVRYAAAKARTSLYEHYEDAAA